MHPVDRCGELFEATINPQLLQDSRSIWPDTNEGSFLGGYLSSLFQNDMVNVRFGQTMCKSQARNGSPNNDDFEIGFLHHCRYSIDIHVKGKIAKMKRIFEIVKSVGALGY